jgi:hypothetical protein
VSLANIWPPTLKSDALHSLDLVLAFGSVPRYVGRSVQEAFPFQPKKHGGSSGIAAVVVIRDLDQALGSASL